jgi:hypothetical protein
LLFSLLEEPWIYQHFSPKVKMAASDSPSCVAKKRPCPASYITRIESCSYSRDLRTTKPLRSAVPSNNL